ncbi:hypothetical protein Tco_1423761 [Tanacetum coccineum]
MYQFLKRLFVILIYLVLLIIEVTRPGYPYSAATQFGGVTDWYRVLETEVRRHEWQRQAADDLVVQHIMRTQALEAGARVDTLEDTGSSS